MPIDPVPATSKKVSYRLLNRGETEETRSLAFVYVLLASALGAAVVICGLVLLLM